MLHRLEFNAMGCTMLAAVDSMHTPCMLRVVPEWFEAWEQVLSRFRFNSELTMLNQVHNRPVPVSDTLWDVFQAARAAEEMTDGLVTPILLEAIIEAGYDRSFDLLPYQSSRRIDPVLTMSPVLAEIALDEIEQTITLPTHAGIDLGGVAKGWAAHQAMLRMRVDGPALIDAGGDIAISGSRVPMWSASPSRRAFPRARDGALYHPAFASTLAIAALASPWIRRRCSALTKLSA